ncbi:thermonuclease family protein [Patulibacter sp. SYSU D01012]|uniref:thermonuclease family protein n=1 Tax=Patulibacter sp. SYSU D01012 TaxID=2817381 RepID=UPI001B30F7E3
MSRLSPRARRAVRLGAPALLAVVAALAVVIAAGRIDRLGPVDVTALHADRWWGDVDDAVGDALAGDQEVRVVRVVDGDTLLVRTDDGRERVRVLGIDTPETRKEGTPVQCFGPEATRSARRWVDEQRSRVTLARDDAAPDRDGFGRLLRYVRPTRGGRDLSTVQVSGGYARVAAYGQDLEELGALRRAERAARRADRGRWGAC